VPLLCIAGPENAHAPGHEQPKTHALTEVPNYRRLRSRDRDHQNSPAAIITISFCPILSLASRFTRFVSKDSDQTETAPRKFKLGPLGSLNQVTKGLAKTIRAGSVQNLSHFRFWLSGARPWLTR